MSEPTPRPWVFGEGVTDDEEPWGLGKVVVPGSKIIRRLKDGRLVVNPEDCIFVESLPGWDSEAQFPGESDWAFMDRAENKADLFDELVRALYPFAAGTTTSAEDYQRAETVLAKVRELEES